MADYVRKWKELAKQGFPLSTTQPLPSIFTTLGDFDRNCGRADADETFEKIFDDAENLQRLRHYQDREDASLLTKIGRHLSACFDHSARLDRSNRDDFHFVSNELSNDLASAVRNGLKHRNMSQRFLSAEQQASIHQPRA